MGNSAESQVKFFDSLLRLVQDTVYLVLILLLEWVLIEVLKHTVGHGVEIIDRILYAIQVGSAISALILFGIHAVRSIIEYFQWRPQQITDREGIP